MNEDTYKLYPEFKGKELPICLTFKGGFTCIYEKCKVEKCPFED